MNLDFDFGLGMTQGGGLNLNMGFLSTGREADPATEYDLIVVGAGPAGMNAALYAARKGLKVAVLAERIGGQVLDTTAVENWLGDNRIGGEALMRRYEGHVREHEVPITGGVRIEKVLPGDVKTVHASNGLVYRARALILATGTRPRKLGIPGETELSGHGVSYCAICDGSFFQGRDVAVAGGGNAAVGAAIDLARIARSVKLVQRSTLRADKVLVDRLSAMPNVEILLWTRIQEIEGDHDVSGIRVQDANTGEERHIAVDGVFIEIGHNARSDFLADLLETTSHGEIVVGESGQTNIPGIFAAGDVTTVPYKQIVIAAADGARAALKATEWLNRSR